MPYTKKYFFHFNRKKILILSVIIAIFLLTLYSESYEKKLLFLGHKSQKNDAIQTNNRTSGHKPIPVYAQKLKKKLVSRRIYTVGTLYGQKQVDVFAKVTGRISELGPNEGSRIIEGQVLFKIDRSDPGERFLKTPVLSPISGWIGRWLILNAGAQVNPNDPVVTIVDDEKLRSTVFLSPSDWTSINDKAKINLSISGENRAGRILSIARSADPNDSRGRIVIETSNQNQTWRSGMIANITIELEPIPRQLIASSALNITDRGTYIYVIEDDTAKRKTINYKVFDNDQIDITDQIDESNYVITTGSNLLSEGSKVSIIDEPIGGVL